MILAMIGSATLQMIGISPMGSETGGESLWPALQPFGGDPLYQPTANGEQLITLRLAARPLVMGGLEQHALLEAHRRQRDVVPYLRIFAAAGFPIAEFVADVGVRRLSATEEKIGPAGMGHRWEFTAELLVLGRAAGEF